jgi:hypothetical protein
MSDDPEVIPPNKSSVPIRRSEGPVSQDSALPRPDGLVSSWLTAFGARVQAEAFKEIAANVRAQKDVIDAERDRRKSALKLLRTTHKLEEAPDILALDRAERKAERTVKYAEFTAKYEQMEDDRDERAHQRELAKRRRQRELEEADREIIEARRQTFTSKQGFENQERLKELNLEMWQKRKASEQMDAEKIWTLLNRELENLQKPEKAEEGTLQHLAETRATLQQQANEAAASGDASQAEKYEQLAHTLDEMVVAAMRGAPK